MGRELESIAFDDEPSRVRDVESGIGEEGPDCDGPAVEVGEYVRMQLRLVKPKLRPFVPRPRKQDALGREPNEDAAPR